MITLLKKKLIAKKGDGKISPRLLKLSEK